MYQIIFYVFRYGLSLMMMVMVEISYFIHLMVWYLKFLTQTNLPVCPLGNQSIILMLLPLPNLLFVRLLPHLHIILQPLNLHVILVHLNLPSILPSNLLTLLLPSNQLLQNLQDTQVAQVFISFFRRESIFSRFVSFSNEKRFFFNKMCCFFQF